MKNIEIASIVRTYHSGKSEMKLPAAVAWKRRMNMAKLIEANAIIEEALQDVSKQYADDEHSIEKDGQRTVKPEYMAEFAKAQAEILDQDTEVDIRKVKIEDIGDIEVTDADMDTIAFMIMEE